MGQADFSFFYSRNKDMIEYIFGIYPDPITGEFGYGFRSSNLENSEVYGAETEFMLNGNFGRFNINFGGGYTYIHPLDIKKTGNQSDENYLKYRRKHTAKLTIAASLKKFEWGFNSFFKSKILNIDDVFLNPVTREDLLPGFYEYWIVDNTAKLIADFYLAYRITNQLKFSIGIKNLGNIEYMGRPGDMMPQRFYSFQLSGRF
jgi:outer membrane receptor protein involved in Fe transport